MKKKFERENRYVVLKRSDMDLLTDEDRKDLDRICSLVKTSRYVKQKPVFECLVVEAGWPEYESIWNRIESRCDES